MTDLRERSLGVDQHVVTVRGDALYDARLAPDFLPPTPTAPNAVLAAVGIMLIGVCFVGTLAGSMLFAKGVSWSDFFAMLGGLVILLWLLPVKIMPAFERAIVWAWPVLKIVLLALAVAAFLYPFAHDVAEGKVFRGADAGESGIASIYSSHGDPGQNGTTVACPGRRLNDGALTAAHKSLPCGTQVKVTNHSNGKTVVVTIIDRGPYVKGRIIDLTRAAAHALGFNGLAPVTIERVS